MAKGQLTPRAQLALVGTFAVASTASALLFDVPTKLLEFVGGSNPTGSDEQWARVLVAGIVFFVLLVLAMVASALPSEIGIGFLSVKSRDAGTRATDDPLVAQLTARLDDHGTLLREVQAALETQRLLLEAERQTRARVARLEDQINVMLRSQVDLADLEHMRSQVGEPHVDEGTQQ